LIVESALDIQVCDLFLRLSGFVPRHEAFLKIEALNPAGSIKFKPALAMVEDLESRGLLHPGSQLIESSSGNLGIALAIVSNARGYWFTCVTDTNTAPATIALMRAYGARVVVIDRRDRQGGFLASRIDYIAEQVRDDPALIWPNQYANPVNTAAHYRTTAAEIHRQFPAVDVVFVGAGTTGTLTGCARYFARHRPATRVVAVDLIGSTTFGTPPGRRYLPGMGTSRTPEIASLDGVADLLLVSERAAVRTCERVRADHGLLVGPSTGAVLTATESYAGTLPDGALIVAISPDFGDRYANTAYDPAWLAERGLGPPFDDEPVRRLLASAPTPETP
jgi:2,3-diaminopropionate biosynthesis protein SbnA